MTGLFKSQFFAVFAGGLAFLGTFVALIERPLAAVAAAAHQQNENACVVRDEPNQEVEQLAAELRREQEDLKRKESDLRRLQLQIQAEREALNQVTQRVAQVQMEFDQSVVRLKEEELPNLKKLTRMYASMSPEALSAIFKELDDATVARILALMKEDQSAQLLEFMAKEGELQAKRVGALSELLRRTFTEKRKSP
jgi:flagellar motility protein MotE (MotC chaperone)